jgi:hypothetical protein
MSGQWMMQFTHYSKMAAVTVVLGIVLTACASTQKTEAIDEERMLAASGFQMKPADTEKKMAHLKTMPQRKLVPHQKGDEIFYLYADATYCKCLYGGGEKAYQRYQKMAVDQSIEEMALSYQQQTGNPMQEVGTLDAPMWADWGPW